MGFPKNAKLKVLQPLEFIFKVSWFFGMIPFTVDYKLDRSRLTYCVSFYFTLSITVDSFIL